MIEINTWMNEFLSTINDAFGDRVWFVGLQGSYGRGEATETSDIDVVVILDELSITDIHKYNAGEACIVIEGDGRDLSMLKDGSIDCILTDYPWLDMKSNKGGTRAFAQYDCFKYTLEDFEEKARVLKEGCFLVEILPAENENNYEYLYQIKQYAKQAGFVYYAKVTWKKGTFVSNTGRKAKNSQDVMIFSKGKARNMRIDKKKTDATGELSFMSGCNGMLPTMFDVQPVPRKDRIHQSELPLSLCEQILQFVTYEGEVVLDSFAGSGVVGEAALNIKRNCILIEILTENIEKIKNRLQGKANIYPILQ